MSGVTVRNATAIQATPLPRIGSPFDLPRSERSLKSKDSVLETAIFMPSRALTYFTERIFENEAGQSIIMGTLVLSLGFAGFYFCGLAHRFSRRCLIEQATRFDRIGVPFYLKSKVLPRNPLISESRTKLHQRAQSVASMN